MEALVHLGQSAIREINNDEAEILADTHDLAGNNVSGTSCGRIGGRRLRSIRFRSRCSFWGDGLRLRQGVVFRAFASCGADD